MLYRLVLFLSASLLSGVAPFVTCHIEGQLGNQLFETATTLAFAWDYGATPYFPELNSERLRASYNRDAIFFRLNRSSPPRPVLFEYSEPIWYSAQKIPFRPDCYLKGYFQSWKHFHRHRARLLDTFSPSPTYLTQLESKYSDLLACPNTVAIHVRLFSDWKHKLGQFPFLGMDYYKQAMALFPEDSLFVVFSDKINWCKHHFGHLAKKILFIEGNDHVLDLYLMSKMRNLIMGASTFSWWGGYFNQNPGAKIVVPDQWMRSDFHRFPIDHLADFYLPEWTILPVTFGPYPEDGSLYDSYSQSVDDNG